MTMRIQLSRSQQDIDPNQENWDLMRRFADLFHYTVNESSFSGACEQAFESALEACKHKKWTTLSQEEVKDDLARLAVYFKSSLVHYAISQNEPWASEFINQRIDIHSLDFQGNSALHTAAREGAAHLIPFLTPHIDIHKENYKKQTPLEIAIQFGKDQVVLELIKKGVNINRSISVGEDQPIFLTGIGFAVMRGEIQCIEKLIVEGRASLEDQYEGIGNILHLAIHFHQFDSLAYLLEEHKDRINGLINQKNHFGQTPLILAVSAGEQKPIHLLHKAGVYLECEDNQKRRQMHYAAVGFHFDIIQLLAALGCKIDPLDEKHQRPIDLIEKESGREAESCKALLRTLKADKTLRQRFPSPYFQPPKNLVFRGGGPKGLAFVGALTCLHEQGHLSSIKRVAGTSAGAITASLVAIGYPMDKLQELLMTTDLMTFLDHPLSSKKLTQALREENRSTLQVINTLQGVIRTCSDIYKNPLGFITNQFKKLYQCTGICDGEAFRIWMEEQIEFATGKKHLTFGELAELVESGSQFKHLHVYGTRVGSNPQIVHMSSQDPRCKDMIISDAVRISMSIPGVFKPHVIHILQKSSEQRDRIPYPQFGSFLDGGMLYNFPIETFDQKQYLTQEDLGPEGRCPKYNKETIGFSLFSSLTPQQTQSNVENIGDLLKGICQVYLGAEEAIRLLNPYNQSRVIEIDVKDVGTLSFNMSSGKKKELVASGRQAMETFINKSTIPSTAVTGLEPEESHSEEAHLVNIQNFHGKQAIDFKKLNTVGDGDCLLHALYGGENIHGQIQVPDAADMRKRLCNDILDYDKQIHSGVQELIIRGGSEHPTLRSYDEHNQIEEQPQNIVNLATSLGRPGEYLGLEHVELIARLKNLNILVYNERTKERVELFYKGGSTEIDHVISYNGINHWSKLIPTSQPRVIDYPNTPYHKEAIESRKTTLAEKRMSHPEEYPSYLENLLEKGYIHLYDHLLDMKELPTRNEREEKIRTLPFSEISHIILETQKSVIDQVISIIPSDMQNILFLLGQTGAGKSTTLCFLRGDEMVVDVNGKYSSTNEQDDLIGHGVKSCTFLPTVEMLSNLAIIDFPGFSDTNGSLISLGMECALKRLIEKYQPKILVLEAITNTEGRYAAAAQLGNQLKRLLGNTESCILGITKYSKDVNFVKVRAIEAEQRRVLTSPSPEEQALEIQIKALTDLNMPPLQPQIETLQKQLAELKGAKLEQTLEDLPETEEKIKHRQEVEKKEKDLSEQIGLRHRIPLFDLESSQKRDHYLNRLSALNIGVSWSTQQILDANHKKLIEECFEKDLMPKIDDLQSFDVADLDAFEQRVLESSLIKVLLSSSHPEIGEFLHLPEIDPKIVDNFSKRIVVGCIKKIINKVIQTIDITLIEKILENFGGKASSDKKETLKKKQEQVQNYILGLEGITPNMSEQSSNEKWEKLRKEKQTHIETIEQGVEDQFQLSPLWNFVYSIPLGIPLWIHNSSKRAKKMRAIEETFDNFFDQYCQSLDDVYSALVKLKSLEKVIHKKEELNRAAQQFSISFESLECLEESIDKGIDKVKESYGTKDWDHRVSFLRSKIREKKSLSLASMLYLGQDPFLEIIKIKGDVVRVHRFLERGSIIEDKALVLVSDTETIVLKKYREKEKRIHEVLASLDIESAALQVEVIAGESLGSRDLQGVNLAIDANFVSATGGQLMGSGMTMSAGKSTFISATAAVISNFSDTPNESKTLSREKEIKYLTDIKKELEINLKDPLSQMLLKDVIKPQVKKDWFLGKKIIEKTRSLFCFEFGKSQWGTCFGDIGAEPPLPDNIREILDSPCVFWPDKKVKETHILVLIPNTINGNPFNLNHLSELIKKPKVGYETQYRFYNSDLKKELGAKSYPSHWVLMTRDVIPGSQNKSYEDIKAHVQQHAQQSAIPYELPTALEAATAILMEHVKTGEKLYSGSDSLLYSFIRYRGSFTVCQEKVNKDQWPAAIGGFSSGGLFVIYHWGDDHGLRRWVCPEVLGYRFLDLWQLIGARWKIAIGPRRGLEAPSMILLGAQKISIKNSETSIFLLPNKHFSKLKKNHVDLHGIKSLDKIEGIGPWRGC